MALRTHANGIKIFSGKAGEQSLEEQIIARVRLDAMEPIIVHAREEEGRRLFSAGKGSVDSWTFVAYFATLFHVLQVP